MTFQLPLSGSLAIWPVFGATPSIHLSTPSLGITDILHAGNGEREVFCFQLPLSGSPTRFFQNVSTTTLDATNFQLPLSGSLNQHRGRQRTGRGSRAFNSLSRDHSIPLRIGSQVGFSTFQLPLSGSLPSFVPGTPKTPPPAFNSLSRDHLNSLRTSSTTCGSTTFQLPLSGSQIYESEIGDLINDLLSTPSLGIT